jgi:hypothetical protein
MMYRELVALRFLDNIFQFSVDTGLKIWQVPNMFHAPVSYMAYVRHTKERNTGILNVAAYHSRSVVRCVEEVSVHKLNRQFPA